MPQSSPTYLVCGDVSIRISHFPPYHDKMPGRNTLKGESFICTEDLGDPRSIVSGKALCLGAQLVSAGWNRKQTAWAAREAHSPSNQLPVRLKAVSKGITTPQSHIVIWGQILEHKSPLGDIPRANHGADLLLLCESCQARCL